MFQRRFSRQRCMRTVLTTVFIVAAAKMASAAARAVLPASFNVSALRYLSSAEAAAIDAELMHSPGFSIDQLMELAGQAVALATAAQYDVSAHRRVLCVCGPGNNGGDGLVAARHLAHFGYAPTVLLPKEPRVGTDAARLMSGLLHTVRAMGVPVLTQVQPSWRDALPDHFELVIDAVFGFSFTGAVRPPFDDVLALMHRWCRPAAARVDAGGVTEVADGVPVVSVDIPSGWHVEEGDTAGTGFMPNMLVSLTAPKRCARYFNGEHHWLGGRFVPPAMARAYGLDTGLPPYPGAEYVVRLPSVMPLPLS